MYKTMMIATIAVFMLALSTFAQPRLSPKERVKALTERLSLTTDQAAQIEQIYVKAQKQMKQMNAGEEKSDRSVMRKMMEDTRTQVVNVLDDKQKVEFQKMQDERKKGTRNSPPDNKTNDKAGTQTHQKKD